MDMRYVLIGVVILAIFAVWKIVTAKLIKAVIELALIVVLIGLIYFIATGNGDKLPGGKNFEKCAFCGKQTEYFCVEHKQWECDGCHKDNN